MKIDYSKLNFEEIKKNISLTLSSILGKEKKKNTSNSKLDYELSATYGDFRVDWTVFVAVADKINIQVSIENLYVEGTTATLKSMGKKVYTALGLVEDLNNRNKNVETLLGKGQFDFISPENETLKKLGKFSDFLDL